MLAAQHVLTPRPCAAPDAPPCQLVALFCNDISPFSVGPKPGGAGIMTLYIMYPAAPLGRLVLTIGPLHIALHSGTMSSPPPTVSCRGFNVLFVRTER